MRAYIAAGAIALLLIISGGLFWAGDRRAKNSAEIERLERALATAERASNADKSKGDANDDLIWLRGASERLRGGR